eukprot:9302661-Pyramimonas_sp.AAC.1
MPPSPPLWSHPNRLLKRSWATLGRSWGRPGDLLGHSWVSSGPCLGHLEAPKSASGANRREGSSHRCS